MICRFTAFGKTVYFFNELACGKNVYKPAEIYH